MVFSEYLRIPARYPVMTRRLLLLAAISWLFAGAALAQTPVIRETGTYIMLLDRDGKAIAGSYWLSPDLKIAVTATEHGGYPSEPLYVDREFMPQRRGVMLMFVNSKATYSPDPLSLSIGEEARIVRREQSIGAFAGPDIRETPSKLTVTGVVATNISGFKLINRLYRLESYDLTDQGQTLGDRVYVETLDMDLSKDIADRVASLETGTALSSGDFYIKYMIKADVLPQQTKCLKEKQALDTYEATALRQREGSDKMMATSFIRDGKAFWEIGDDFPADAKAMSIYELCSSN